MIKHNLLLVLYIVSLILSILVGFLIGYRSILPVMAETHFIWDKIPNFSALFGFFGSIVLLTVSMMLKMVLSRDEGYYDESDDLG